MCFLLFLCLFTQFGFIFALGGSGAMQIDTSSAHHASRAGSGNTFPAFLRAQLARYIGSTNTETEVLVNAMLAYMRTTHGVALCNGFTTDQDRFTRVFERIYPRTISPVTIKEPAEYTTLVAAYFRACTVGLTLRDILDALDAVEYTPIKTVKDALAAALLEYSRQVTNDLFSIHHPLTLEDRLDRVLDMVRLDDLQNSDTSLQKVQRCYQSLEIANTDRILAILFGYSDDRYVEYLRLILRSQASIANRYEYSNTYHRTLSIIMIAHNACRTGSYTHIFGSDTAHYMYLDRMIQQILREVLHSGPLASFVAQPPSSARFLADSGITALLNLYTELGMWSSKVSSNTSPFTIEKLVTSGAVYKFKDLLTSALGFLFSKGNLTDDEHGVLTQILESIKGPRQKAGSVAGAVPKVALETRPSQQKSKIPVDELSDGEITNEMAWGDD